VSKVASEVRKQIVKAQFEKEVSSSLTAYYDELHTRLLHAKGKSIRLVLTGVGEDRISISQHVKSASDFEKALKQLYSFAFDDRALLNRLSTGKKALPESFTVIVQYVEAPEFSGKAFCHDLNLHDDNTIEIHAWHFQKALKHEPETQDVFRIDRKSLGLLSRNIRKQWWAEDASGKFVSPKHLGKDEAALKDEQAISLARLTRQAQQHFTHTIGLEWVFSHSQFMITRVVRMEGANSCECQQPASDPQWVSLQEVPLFKGLPASFGKASGPVRLVAAKKDRLKVLPGDVLVVEHLTLKDKEWIPAVSAIITEAGTLTTAEALLAKELMVPAVTGASKALSLLKEGQYVTVDGNQGLVYKGVRANGSAAPLNQALPVTGTKIWSLVTDPYQMDVQAVHQSDGVGLLRGEFILRMLGVHPEDILRQQLAGEYTDILAEGISRVVQAVSPHPVIYQLHDLTSMDSLGIRPRHHERHEPNPSLGYRGAHRLLSEPEVLDLELDALAQISNRGVLNLSVMIPMARTVKEVERMLSYLRKAEFARNIDLKVWVKCETPGMLILMEDLCALDIAGVCFDVPSLCQFMQGIDRENRQVAHHLDTTDGAIEQALSYAIGVCREEGVATMVVAEGEDLRPEVIQNAIQAGVTGLSVIPSQVQPMYGLVAAVEQRVLLDHALAEHDE
jgi:pyruvate,water dikinase